MANDIDHAKLITLTEAAKRLPGHIKANTIRFWIAEGRLRGYRVGASRLLVNIDDLAEMVQLVKPDELQ
jgi:excisionase family DNA binding protein